MDEGRFSISPQSVYERLGTAAAPLIVDVRCEPAFAEAGQLVVGMVMYDARYAWCRSLRGETHGWNPELGR